MKNWQGLITKSAGCLLNLHDKRLATAGSGDFCFVVVGLLQRWIGANNHRVLLLPLDELRQGIHLQLFLLKLGNAWLGSLLRREHANLQRISMQLAHIRI